jgi:prepilin-type N-terminal cleavage/methylation domain-containing protein
MKQSSHNQSAGFTLIEILVVLAIAGLILGLVIGALPAMQRNSNNNRRKQDVAAILGAVSRYGLNHSGNFPDPADGYLQFTRLSIYEPAQVFATALSAGTAAPSSPNTNLETVFVNNYQKCSTTSPGSSTSVGAGYSDVVALYAIETSAGSAPQCLQL